MFASLFNHPGKLAAAGDLWPLYNKRTYYAIYPLTRTRFELSFDRIAGRFATTTLTLFLAFRACGGA